MPVAGITGSSAITYTTADLVQLVQDMTFVSGSSRDWPPDKIIRLLNRSLFNYLVPFVIAADEEFYVVYKDVAIVTGQSNYALPTGCHNSNLRIIQLLDAQGNPSRVLPQRELDVALTPFTLFGVTAGLGAPSSFYVEGNQLFLVPIPTASNLNTLRVHYPLRPSQLVAPYDYSGPGGTSLGTYTEGYLQKITAYNTGTNTITTSNVASNVFAGTSPFVQSTISSTQVDIISADPPFDILATTSATIAQQTAGAVPSVTSYTIGGPVSNPTDVNSGLAVGQSVWIAVSGTSPVVTATPIEVSFGMLSQWSIAKVMESKGDDEGYQRAMRSLVVEEERAKEMLRRRVRGPGKRAFANPYSGKGGRGIVAFYT